MRARGGVRVLSLDQLERVYCLGLETVVEEKRVRLAGRLIEPGSDGIVVDFLRRVRIERAGTDVGPVRQLVREGVENPGHEIPEPGIFRQRRSFVGSRNQDISVDVAANSLLAPIDGEVSAAP